MDPTDEITETFTLEVTCKVVQYTTDTNRIEELENIKIDIANQISKIDFVYNVELL